jgi:hypothetical protein
MYKMKMRQQLPKLSSGCPSSGMKPLLQPVPCCSTLHAQALAEFTTGKTVDALCPWWRGLEAVWMATPQERDLQEILRLCMTDMPAPSGSEFMFTWRRCGAPLFTAVYRGDEVDALLLENPSSAQVTEATSQTSRTILFSHLTRSAFITNDRIQLSSHDPPLLVQYLCDDDRTNGCLKVVDVLGARHDHLRENSPGPRQRAALMQALDSRWRHAAESGCVKSSGMGVMWCGDLTVHALRDLCALQRYSLRHTIQSLVLLTTNPLVQVHIDWEPLVRMLDRQAAQDAQKGVVRVSRAPAWYTNLTALPFDAKQQAARASDLLL